MSSSSDPADAGSGAAGAGREPSGGPTNRPEAGPQGGPGQPMRLRFTRAQRLEHAREFDAVFSARVRKVRPPLVVLGRPNGLSRTRLGLSVGRSVGSAVVRSRVKRLIREAFRLEQHGLPVGFDLVVNVRVPGASIKRLETVRATLVDLARQIEREWARRQPRDSKSPPPPAPTPSPPAPALPPPSPETRA